jgi:hypothetical protein
MPGARWIKVDATIVECFRAWDERPGNIHPRFEIVADITTPAGAVERVSSQQKLNTRTHHWRAPEPGDVVPAKWDPTRGNIRLELGGDLRYDENVIRAVSRNRAPPAWPPSGSSGGSG